MVKGIGLSKSATLTVSLFSVFAIGVFGQETADIEQKVEDIEEVVVIGTRIGFERSAEILPVPIETHNAFELARTGEIDLSAALAKLVPSFNYSRQSGGDGAIFNAATLRGLAPDQTLVLVNGKRRHSIAWNRILDGVIGYGTGGTDLRAIPVSAIEAIEVLRDGAAAQYGSDAIAGVINLRLKESPGGEVQIHAGRTDAGDATNGLSFNGGLRFDIDGYVNISVEWFDAASLARNGGNGGVDSKFQDELITASSPDHSGHSFFFNAATPIGTTAGLYTFGGIADRGSTASGAFRFPVEYWDGLESGDATWDFVIPNFIHFHERNTHVVYPDGFLPSEEAEIADRSLVVGLNQTVRTWDLDLSVGFGENVFDFGVSNSINPSIGAQYLQGNPTASVAEIVANSGPKFGDSGGIAFDQITINLDLQKVISNHFFTGIALGLEHRQESYEQRAGDTASWSCGLPHDGAFSAFAVGPDGKPLYGVVAACGYQGFPGYSPRNAQLSANSRRSQGAYLELESDVTNKTTIGGALRIENYSDAGGSVTGKLSTRMQLYEHSALRGSLSTGFRAPSLSQRGFNSIVFVGGDTGLTTVFSANEGHPISQEFGVDKLDHESSRSISLGLVWNPNGINLNLTIDGYWTGIADRIVRSQSLDCGGSSVCSMENVSATAFFFNAIDTETSGLDLTMSWNVALPQSQLTIQAGGHTNTTEIVRRKLPSGAPPGLTFADYFGGWAADLLENGQPKTKQNFSASWQKKQWNTFVQLTHYGKTIQNPFDTGRVTIESAQTVDLSAQYGQGRTSVKFGINNLFDELPTKLAKTHLVNVLWGVQYPNDTPFGLQGRYAYLTLGFQFGK